MIREVIATGRDAENAIENGCRELGVPREEVDFEIISLPKKSFFGLKTHPAKVRVFVELPDIERTPVEKPAKSEPKARAPKSEPAAKKEQPKTPQKKEQAPKQQKPAPKKTSPKPPREEKKPEAEPKKELVPIQPDDALVARVTKAMNYLTGVLTALGITELQIEPAYYEDGVRLQLTGTGLGIIIGRRGETLDALQYLSSLVANRGEGEYVRISIDSGNYREKRERTLESLAKKLANQAVRTGKSTTLEPMNPYERRIIHGAVSQVKGATSSSVGADPHRRVVISSTGSKKSSGTGNGGGRSRNRGRGRTGGSTGGSRGANGGSRPPRQEVPTSIPDDLDLNESIQVKLEAPPPPAPRPKAEDSPVPQVAAPAPETHEQETPTQPDRKLDQKEVEQAPRYGKIEF